MQITTVMVVAFLIWCPITLPAGSQDSRYRPRLFPAKPAFSRLRHWAGFQGTIFPQIGFIAIVIAFGHSLLSMEAAFETLAQVYRENRLPQVEETCVTPAILVCIYCRGVHRHHHPCLPE